MKMIVVILLAFASSCNMPDSGTTKGNESLAISEAQTMLWYNSMASLRNGVEPSWKVDVLVVNNYFPLFLAQRKHGFNEAQFSITASSFRNLGREKAESSIWKIRENAFTEYLYIGPLKSFGFDLNEINTFEKFQKARSEYFDALEKKTLHD